MASSSRASAAAIGSAKRRGLFAPLTGVCLALTMAVVLLVLRRPHVLEHAAARPAPAAALPGAVVADDAGPLREVLMHYVAELEPTFGDAYRDFLVTLAPETRIVFVVRRQDRARLDAFLAGLDPSGGLARRTRVAEISRPMGIWSKDRALVLGASAGTAGASSAGAGVAGAGTTRTELVIPPRTRPGEGSRPVDWDIVPAVAAALPDSFAVRQLPIAFDAGDFAVTTSRVVIDVNLFARNHSRGFRSAEELRERVKTLLGRDVSMLGKEPGDVPRHHMSMYMALLDGGVALVGDPEAGARLVGRDYVPGENSPETNEPLRADFSPATVARFERAAADLTAAGFRVVRIPTVPFDDKTYFAYTNGVYETRRGEGGGGRGEHRVAWVPRFGVPALDNAARDVYERLGWSVIPVSVRSLYRHHGTIGCVVNVVSRGE